MIYRSLLIVLATLLLAACSVIAPGPEQNPLGQASAVSVALPGFITNRGTTLRWRGDLQWVDDPDGRYKRRGDVLQQALQREFESKGYQFKAPGEPADYDVVAIALLGRLEDNQELVEVFRLYPSLAKPAKGYNYGTVMVAIAPAGTRDIVWRGALEVFTDPEKQPVQQRYERLEWAAKKLLQSIPYLP